MKRFVRFSFLFILMLVLPIGVYAAAENHPNAYVKDGDFIASCIYENGLNITVMRNEIIINSNSNTSDYSSGVSLWLTPTQREEYDKFLAGGKCPSKLYAYSVKADNLDDVSGGVSSDLKVDSTLYATGASYASDMGTTTTGWWIFSGQENVATRVVNNDTSLVSESIDLLSTKTVTVCDYQRYSVENKTYSSSTASFYLFSNVTFLEVDGYVTALSESLSTCPSDDVLYINSPNLYVYSAGNGTTTVLTYPAVRYYYAKSNKACSSNNDNKACSTYKYLGTRNDTGSSSNSSTICEKIGGKLVEIIQEIVGILQIVVPILVIVLTALDIGKLVVNGNLDEELPKRKKLIIIRLIVMVLFFFLPTITNVIINLLKDAGLVGVETVECLFK